MSKVTEDDKKRFSLAILSIVEGLKAIDSAIYHMTRPERDEIREAIVETKVSNQDFPIRMTAQFTLMEIVEVATRLQERLKG